MDGRGRHQEHLQWQLDIHERGNCKSIKCCHCGDYTPFITEENIEVIPQVNLTRADMDILDDIADTLAECGYSGMCGFLHWVQSEVTKIVEYQEEQ